MANSNLHLPIPVDIGDYLSYDKDTGQIVLVRNPISEVYEFRVGKPWGGISPLGYYVGKFRGQAYLHHRVIWFMMTGEDPREKTVDHIDRNRSNNRWENLRLLDGAREQAFNKGALGYSVERRKLRVRFNNGTVMESLGNYECPLLARIVYHDRVREAAPEMNIPFVPDAEIKGNPFHMELDQASKQI